MSNIPYTSSSPTGSSFYQNPSYDSSTPPPPPPKPTSHEPSRLGTPNAPAPAPAPAHTTGPPLPPHPSSASAEQWQSPQAGPNQQYQYGQTTHPSPQDGSGNGGHPNDESHLSNRPSIETGRGNGDAFSEGENLQDPLGPEYIPPILKNKTTQDLTTALSTPSLFNSLSHAPPPPALLHALSQNIHNAQSLSALETRLTHQRHATQTRLLHCHALERAWRAKQAEMDEVLAPFAPKALYVRLGAAVAEQEAVCEAVVETFLDGHGGEGSEGKAGEREVADWLRRVREGRKIYWRRREAKARWDDGRVGGWR
ncbi:MAG: hypothetical protein M1837_004113 [Sclerophora amabilis]|nr:MAG: hypothetical protein M1837_004113 [Sclerophora amabilis]